LRREAGRRRGHALQQQVRGAAREACQLPRQATVHHEAVDAALELLQAFRLDLVPARHRRYDQALLSAELRCSERGELLTEQWLVAGFTVRRAQLHFTAAAQEVDEAIRRCRLREDEILVRVTVDAAALGAQTGLHEQPLVEEPHAFLEVQRERALLREVLVHRRVRAAVHVALTWQQVLRTDVEGGETPVLVLHARRRRRGEA